MRVGCWHGSALLRCLAVIVLLLGLTTAAAQAQTTFRMTSSFSITIEPNAEVAVYLPNGTVLSIDLYTRVTGNSTSATTGSLTIAGMSFPVTSITVTPTFDYWILRVVIDYPAQPTAALGGTVDILSLQLRVLRYPISLEFSLQDAVVNSAYFSVDYPRVELRP